MSLKNGIPYSQVLTICSSLTEYKKHCTILKQKSIERGYEENILKDKRDELDNTDRKDLLRKKRKSNKDKIPCLIMIIENFQ